MTTKTFYELVRHAPKGRWNGIKRNYGPEEVLKLRGSMHIEYTLATSGANKLWTLLHNDPYIHALGALTGNQAMQMVRAGLKAIYLSGWQVAADNNTAGCMYPDQSLYPANAGPELARRINKTLQRADQIESSEGGAQHDWFAPIVADAEAGFGGPLNCFEIMKAYIEAGAAGVHFEDQLAAEKKCGHLGGKVLIPTWAHERNLNAARLAADVCGVPTVLVSRTDAESATLITSEVDERDHEFIDFAAGRTTEGFYRLKKDSGLAHCIKRGISTAPYADLLWWETSTPNLQHAKQFAEAVRKVHPDKMLAYNCSPSFNWEANLSKEVIANFQRELAAMGYKFQFVTLAGFHSLNYGMFNLASGYKEAGMSAYSKLQQAEFSAEEQGYTAVRHQREVGTGYFDLVATAAAGGKTSTKAYADSTESSQFNNHINDKAKLPNLKGLETTRQSVRAYSTQPARKLSMEKLDGDEQILSQEALEFVAELHTTFDSRRQKLLAARKDRQAQLDAGERPDFSKDTHKIRSDKSWKVGPCPKDIENRQVEITGPCDRKMVINALNSGADVYMADFEDSTTPTWRNLVDGQKNIYDAVRHEISFNDKKSGKSYKLADKPAVLFVRPRGWHLPEKHFLIDGQPVSGSLFDFGIYMFHNAQVLLNRKTGPYFYLPKMQSHHEAVLWNDVFNYAQDWLNIPRGSIKATVLIEHVLATFEATEILHALKEHSIGLNCGRWDYIFSYIKAFRNHPHHTLPDRSQLSMTVPFLRSYSQFVINACHQRGAHAMGGMAAQIPIRNDPEASEKALNAVRRDKIREVTDGHDGTWVAHPALVPLAKKIFQEHLKGAPNQIGRPTKGDFQPTATDLLAVPDGTRTEHGLRHNVSVTLGYLEAWMRGVGCVPLFNLMEDAATAEISRTQLWQWLHHTATLEDGRKVDSELVTNVIKEEKDKWAKQMKYEHRLDTAADLLSKLVHAKELPEFLTLLAYDQLVAEGH